LPVSNSQLSIRVQLVWRMCVVGGLIWYQRVGLADGQPICFLKQFSDTTFPLATIHSLRTNKRYTGTTVYHKYDR